MFHLPLYFRRDSWRYLIPDPYNWKGKCWRAQDYQFVIPRKVQKLSISWQSVTEVLTNLRCGAQSVCCAASINNITGELTFLKTTILGIFCSPATLSPVAKKSWRLFKIFWCRQVGNIRDRVEILRLTPCFQASGRIPTLPYARAATTEFYYIRFEIVIQSSSA